MGRKRFVGLLIVLLAVGGCGPKAKPPAPKYAVSGTVLLNGKPMPEGDIKFATVQTGAFETIPIRDGKFEGKAEAGERRVEIYAYKEVPANPMYKGTDMDKPVRENYLPAEYNSSTKLPLAKVSAEGPNTFEFKVTSK